MSKVVNDKGFQLWLETVGNNDKVGILIEDGNIISMDGEKVERKKVFQKPKVLKENDEW